MRFDPILIYMYILTMIEDFQQKALFHLYIVH
jgi:hypothetical protein